MVMFMMIKGYNKLAPKEVAAPATKICPECSMSILALQKNVLIVSVYRSDEAMTCKQNGLHVIRKISLSN